MGKQRIPKIYSDDAYSTRWAITANAWPGEIHAGVQVCLPGTDIVVAEVELGDPISAAQDLAELDTTVNLRYKGRRGVQRIARIRKALGFSYPAKGIESHPTEYPVWHGAKL